MSFEKEHTGRHETCARQWHFRTICQRNQWLPENVFLESSDEMETTYPRIGLNTAEDVSSVSTIRRAESKIWNSPSTAITRAKMRGSTNGLHNTSACH